MKYICETALWFLFWPVSVIYEIPVAPTLSLVCMVVGEFLWLGFLVYLAALVA